MSKITVVRRDPWASLRERGDVDTFFNTAPKTTATMSVPTSQGMRIGWSLFWRSLWWTIRRRKAIEFWMEGEE